MYYFIVSLSVILILFITLVLMSYFSYVSIFKRGKNSKSELKKTIKKYKKSGEENPSDLLKKADDFFENIRYKKTEIYAFDELTLYAKLYTPQNGVADKTVLLAHGCDSSANADFYEIFDFYRNSGFNVLLIHQRAHGKSEGKIKSMGITEGYDVLSWCHWLEMKFSTGCPIIIHGKDQGAFAALSAVTKAELPANVKAVVCENAFNSVDDFTKIILKNKFDFLSKMMMPFVRSFYKRATGFDMRGVEISRLAKRIRTPVLLINNYKTLLSSDTFEEINKKVKVPVQSVSLKKSDKKDSQRIRSFLKNNTDIFKE
ncbi:MAG: hypothetical protein IJU45_00395 [Clostridia bacterium]|nr:hypothetical protein [Clostridia bacterium]